MVTCWGCGKESIDCNENSSGQSGLRVSRDLDKTGANCRIFSFFCKASLISGEVFSFISVFYSGDVYSGFIGINLLWFDRRF